MSPKRSFSFTLIQSTHCVSQAPPGLHGFTSAKHHIPLKSLRGCPDLLCYIGLGLGLGFRGQGGLSFLHGPAELESIPTGGKWKMEGGRGVGRTGGLGLGLGLDSGEG